MSNRRRSSGAGRGANCDSRLTYLVVRLKCLVNNDVVATKLINRGELDNNLVFRRLRKCSNRIIARLLNKRLKSKRRNRSIVILHLLVSKVRLNVGPYSRLVVNYRYVC